MDAAKMKGEEEEGYNTGNQIDTDTGLSGDLKKKMVLDKEDEDRKIVLDKEDDDRRVVFMKIFNNFCTEEIEAAGYTLLEDDMEDDEKTMLETSRAFFEWLNNHRPEQKPRPKEEDDYAVYFTRPPPGPKPDDTFVHDGGVYVPMLHYKYYN